MQTKTSSKGIIWGITQKSLFNIYFSFPAALSANGGHRSGPAGRRRSCCVVGKGGRLWVEHSDRLRMVQQKRLNETKQSNNGRALFSNLSALCVRVWIRIRFGLGARGSGSLGIGSLLLLLLI